MPRKIPIKTQAFEYVAKHPWSSAQEVGRAIGSSYGTVSSSLLRLVREGHLIREDNMGPQGGWGYAWPGTPLPTYDVNLSKNPLQDRILSVIKSRPWFTTREITEAAEHKHQGSVYQAIQRLMKRGNVVCTPNCGPRGGKGYAVPGETAIRKRGEYLTRRTLWEHLEEESSPA